ncbi:hypothetical protein E2C01_009372 [Portunus trituberculatus]|uniref:Uncharacterized protein n=1 Tax=Portunus trituberculatus TaxID=210409 RepID=A0A5B7D5S1_PORTR|nr:hypothetical protein [Portunus trituberculatus]
MHSSTERVNNGDNVVIDENSTNQATNIPNTRSAQERTDTLTHHFGSGALEHKLELGPLQHVLQSHCHLLQPQRQHHQLLCEVVDNPGHPSDPCPAPHFLKLFPLVHQGVQEGGQVLLQDSQFLQLSEMEILRHHTTDQQQIQTSLPSYHSATPHLRNQLLSQLLPLVVIESHQGGPHIAKEPHHRHQQWRQAGTAALRTEMRCVGLVAAGSVGLKICTITSTHSCTSSISDTSPEHKEKEGEKNYQKYETLKFANHPPIVPCLISKLTVSKSRVSDEDLTLFLKVSEGRDKVCSGVQGALGSLWGEGGRQAASVQVVEDCFKGWVFHSLQRLPLYVRYAGL